MFFLKGSKTAHTLLQATVSYKLVFSSEKKIQMKGKTPAPLSPVDNAILPRERWRKRFITVEGTYIFRPTSCQNEHFLSSFCSEIGWVQARKCGGTERQNSEKWSDEPVGLLFCFSNMDWWKRRWSGSNHAWVASDIEFHVSSLVHRAPKPGLTIPTFSDCGGVLSTRDSRRAIASLIIVQLTPQSSLQIP